MLRKKFTTAGTTIIAFGTYGPVRGYGPLRITAEEAFEDRRQDAINCKSQRGYTDRKVVAVDSRGRCWDLVVDDNPNGYDVGGWVRGEGGHRAAYYSAEEIAELPVRAKSGRLLRVRVVEVGQSFGVQGQLLDGDTVVASTDVIPNDMRGAADEKARELASAL